MGRTVLGIDIGTSKVAAAILDADRRLLVRESELHCTDQPGPAGHAIQDVGALFETVLQVVRALPAEARAQVGAVGLTGQMHGVTVLDGKLCPVVPLVTWQDQRCQEAGFLDLVHHDSGYLLSTGFGCGTLAWLSRHHALPPTRGERCFGRRR